MNGHRANMRSGGGVCVGEDTDIASRPCGAARSARHPVKVETVGSNPIGVTETTERFCGENGTVRKVAERPSSDLGELWVRLPLVPSRIEGGVSHGGL